MELTNKDYVSILKYYNMDIPKSKRLIKKQAEHIMANKLCKCIKKIDPINEAKSIGICTKTVINKHNLSRGNFSCKGKRKITLKKLNKLSNKTIKNKK